MLAQRSRNARDLEVTSIETGLDVETATENSIGGLRARSELNSQGNR